MPRLSDEYGKITLMWHRIVRNRNKGILDEIFHYYTSKKLRQLLQFGIIAEIFLRNSYYRLSVLPF